VTAVERERNGADLRRLVKLTEIAVDGTKLRANAGKGSFKSRSKRRQSNARCTRIGR